MQNADYEKINQELVKTIQGGGRAARRAEERLLSFNEGLLYKYTRQYISDSHYDDYRQIAGCALIEAAHKYCSATVSFGSYASIRIKNRVTDEYRQHSRIVRLPHRSINTINAQLDDGDYVSGLLLHQTRIDKTDAETGCCIFEKKDDSDGADLILEQNERDAAVSAIYAALPENDREIITRHIINGETLQSIADEKGCTAQNIKYRVDKVINSMRGDKILKKLL